jgi:L-arabinokinase
LGPFEPAIELLETPRAARLLSPGAPVFIARAPGRLDVMGGIADYSGAVVLQLPLDRSTFALLQRQDAPRCEIVSLRAGAAHEFSIEMEPLVAGELASADALREWFSLRPADHWAAYVVGVAQLALQRAGARADAGGFRLLLDSRVPEGKGVSSSAALEVAALSAIAAAYELDLGPEELATACQWVENRVVGAPCGIMDQMTSATGLEGSLLRLRCQPAIVEGHLPIPEGYRFFGADSGLRHAVTGAAYGTVRTAAFMGYRMIAALAGLGVAEGEGGVRVEDPRWGGYLANIDPAEFERDFAPHLPERMRGEEFLRLYGGITDRVTSVNPALEYPVRVATAHPVHEQARVEGFAALLGERPLGVAGAEAMGALMYASHASYGACGLGSPGTDRLVELVREAGVEQGLFGAKITGGGSGGTVAILAADGAEAEASVHGIVERYRGETGIRGEVFAGSGPGAAETGVLRIDP